MKKNNIKKSFIFGMILPFVPASFLISSGCNTKTKQDEKEIQYHEIKNKIATKLNNIKDSSKKEQFQNEFLNLFSLEETKNFTILIEKATQLLNKINQENSTNEDQDNDEGKETPKPENEDNSTTASGFAPTTSSGYAIEYDSSNSFYSSLNGLSGETLRNELFKIQVANRDKTGSYAALHETYKDAFVDKYYENDGTVLDLYTEIPNGKDKHTFRFGQYRDTGNREGAGMNREHIIAQSWFSKQSPMRNDAHHVWPSDKYVNAIHGNFPYGETKNGDVVSSNGSKLGNGIEDGRKVFEVIDEFKGDIARVFFYFALTYGDKSIANNESGSRVFEFQKGKYKIKSNYLKTYLKWNKNDGISQFDIDRNNGIFKHQGNRNPFIDYPELIKVYFENDNSFIFNNKGVAKKLIKINN